MQHALFINIPVKEADAPYSAAQGEIVRQWIDRIIIKDRWKVKGPCAERCHSLILKNVITEVKHSENREQANDKSQEPANSNGISKYFMKYREYPLHDREFHSHDPVRIRFLINARMEYIDIFFMEVIDDSLGLRLPPYVNTNKVPVEYLVMHKETQNRDEAKNRPVISVKDIHVGSKGQFT